MSRTNKPKSAPIPQLQPQPAVTNGPLVEVLTLAEAAAYLRFPEADVLRLVNEQALPARRMANEWRFLKAAVQQWLSTPPPKGSKEAQLAVGGPGRMIPTWRRN